MSKLCFSFPADTPGNGPGHAIPPPGLSDPVKMPYSCYSYPLSCYSYPDDTPRGGNSGAAQPPLPGLRRMPLTCFRY
jgi:hypothetical protein